MKVNLFTIVKNESYLMKTWLPYHINIFGKENIYVIDNGSEDDTVELCKNYGVKLFISTESFTKKASILSKIMNENKSCDFLIPLDSDEFICYEDDDGFIFDDRIVSKFNSIKNNNKCKFRNLGAEQDKFDYDDPLIDMKYFARFQFDKNGKTFFRSNNFINTDAGNHCGQIDGNNSEYNDTNFKMFHFEKRGYTQFVHKYTKGAIGLGFDKLDKDKLKNYRGVGCHWAWFYHDIKYEPENLIEKMKKNEGRDLSKFSFLDNFSKYVKDNFR